MARAPDGTIYISGDDRVFTLGGEGLSVFAGTGESAEVDGLRRSASLYSGPITVGMDGVVYLSGFATRGVRTIANGRVRSPSWGAGWGFDAMDVAVAADGTIYLAEKHHRIYVVRDDQRHVLVGTGAAGYRDGPLNIAEIADPRSIAVAPDGTVYFAEGSGRLRQIRAGYVTSLGNGEPGIVDGPVDTASFGAPRGLVVAPDGTLYFTDGHRVRGLRDGRVFTVAGR